MEKKSEIQLGAKEFSSRYDEAVGRYLKTTWLHGRTLFALSLIAARGKRCSMRYFRGADEAMLTRADYVVFLQNVNSDAIYNGLSSYSPKEKLYLELLAAKMTGVIVEALFDGVV